MFIPEDPIPLVHKPLQNKNKPSLTALDDAKKYAHPNGWRSAEQLNECCPQCYSDSWDAVWVDVGVGEVQASPYHCPECGHKES